MTNLQVVNFQNSIVELVNNSGMPIAVTLSIFKNILSEMETVKAQAVQLELSVLEQKRKEENEVKPDEQSAQPD